MSKSLHNSSLVVAPMHLDTLHNVYIRCFCSVKEVMTKLQEYVDDINSNIEKLETRGPVSKYVLPDENLRGRFVLSSSPDSIISLILLSLPKSQQSQLSPAGSR